MLRWMAVALLSLTAVAGCGGAQTGGTDVPTPSSSAVVGPISIKRTGGIAGMNQIIEIALDGSWVYTDRRQNTTQRGTLTETQRTQLLALVSAPGFAQQLLTPVSPPTCADGFHYEISIGTAKGSFDDCGSDDHPALMAVIAAIGDATPL